MESKKSIPDNLKLTIADLNIEIKGSINEYFFDRVAKYMRAYTGDADIRICCQFYNHIEKPEGKVITTIGRKVNYYNENGNFAYYYLLPDKEQVYVNTNVNGNDVDIKIYDFNYDPQLDFRYPFLNATDEASRYVLLQYDAVVLHSSAIAYNNFGIAFSAPSGTGKSTHTTLWKENYDAKIINDDSPIIRFTNDTPYIYGSPWAGSTGINTNTKQPLRAIVFLEQAPENSIEKVDTAIALNKIIKEIYKPNEDHLLSKTLDLLDRLLRNTDCYILKCTPDKRAADLVKNTLF